MTLPSGSYKRILLPPFFNQVPQSEQGTPFCVEPFVAGNDVVCSQRVPIRLPTPPQVGIKQEATQPQWPDQIDHLARDEFRQRPQALSPPKSRCTRKPECVQQYRRCPVASLMISQPPTLVRRHFLSHGEVDVANRQASIEEGVARV